MRLLTNTKVINACQTEFIAKTAVVGCDAVWSAMVSEDLLPPSLFTGWGWHCVSKRWYLLPDHTAAQSRRLILIFMAAEMYFDDLSCSELMFSGSTTVSDCLCVV